MEKKTIKLKRPLEVGGNLLTELEMRKPTIGDDEAALEQAIRMKRKDNAITIALCVIARLTNVPYDKLKQLPHDEWSVLQTAYNEMLGMEGLEPEGENPTTPEIA